MNNYNKGQQQKIIFKEITEKKETKFKMYTLTIKMLDYKLHDFT